MAEAPAPVDRQADGALMPPGELDRALDTARGGLYQEGVGLPIARRTVDRAFRQVADSFREHNRPR